ncbi:MAG TPA: hypothetical protein DIW47_13460 [Bacteroidetes bacterium]|nr:hypothetical protein [Bacteroidota bacterium]
MKHLVIFCLLLLSPSLFAQPYVVGGKTRHRFAQLNLGTDYRFFPGSGTQSAIIGQDGQLEKFELKNQAETRLIISGTHFWGHMDFYVAIPILSVGKSGFSTGVETGAHYFPWRIEHNKIRPYVGVSMLTTQFQQGAGTKRVRFAYPLLAGAVFNHKKHLITMGAGYNPQNSENYFINRTTPVQIKTHAFWFSFGYSFMLETTLSAEKNWQNGKTKRLTDTLAALNRLNGWTLAVGPSSAFFLKPSDHNESMAPYSDNHKAAVFPEFGIGYYWHNPDLQINLSYRKMKSEIAAYSFSQRGSRQALSLEAFKFFVDYHGFAAFAGFAVSYERLHISETDGQQPGETANYAGIKPGITFGWDIRPNRLQSWYLRTTLRYFPNLNVKMADGKTIPFDQLEFNFIQLVVFPGRMF